MTTTFSKIKLHSSVDLITNSSTVIFTYSGGSLSAVKDLVNEMLKVFGKTETFDDIFYADVFCEDLDTYLEDDLYSNFIEENENEAVSDIKVLVDDILTGKVERPKWMDEVEEEESRCDYFTPETALYLKAKDEKYNELANKLLKYLNSQTHEATRDG
jgi:hypothetical protein